MFKTSMPYCSKCKKLTNLDENRSRRKEFINHKGVTHYMVIGPCIYCGTNISVFVNKDGVFTPKSNEERAKSREKRAISTRNKKALKIGLEVLNKNAMPCVKKCINQSNKSNIDAWSVSRMQNADSRYSSRSTSPVRIHTQDSGHSYTFRPKKRKLD
jgi:hypothetical protein